MNSKVTYVVYLLFTRRMAGGFSWVLRWKNPIKLPARQPTSRKLIFASSPRVTLTNFFTILNTKIESWFSLLSLELDYYKIRPGENSYSEQNYTKPHKPCCRIEKTEATRGFLAEQHEVPTRSEGDGWNPANNMYINSLKYNCYTKPLPFSLGSVDLMNKSFNKTIGLALESVLFQENCKHAV